MARNSASNSPRIALVLGGGGMAGYAFHCGVLDALQRSTGWDPRTADLIVGTSAGAIVAALLRGGVAPASIRKRLLESVDSPDDMSSLQLLAGRSPRAIPKFWTGPASMQMASSELRRGRQLRPIYLLTALLPSGRLQLNSISNPIEDLYDNEWPAEPLWIPATDLDSGERVVFGRDELETSVGDAVRASSSLPGFFSPTVIKGRRFVDGGVGSAVNANLIAEMGSAGAANPAAGTPAEDTDDLERPDLVIVLSPLSIARPALSRPIATVVRAWPRRQLQNEIRRIQKLEVGTLVVEPTEAVVRSMGLNPMDPKRMQSIAERADESVGPLLTPDTSTLLEKAAAANPSPPDAYYPSALDA